MQLITSLDLKNSEYLSKDRFISYHHQLRLIFSLGKKVNHILEIGIYNSLLTEILKRNGYEVTTADIDPHLNPDITLDLAQDFALPKDKFDVIVLFQVLEHLPYEQSEKALQKLAAATKKYLVISLPYNSLYLALQLRVSDIPRPRYLSLKIPKFWSTKPISDQHYWEVGLKGYPQKRILKSITNAGLKVKQEFTDPVNPYHYFLVLEKTTENN
ncbi:methyltransferase domain-containing protein [Nostoc sp. FACHB-87]|uniref:class I SAM-dependent methyltransferase n=1 Tax=Nostocales TaxID=1161 RepID=UPI001687F461|nr:MULTISPECIES: methyltransferase domain-containing protein [Nostocales]MBD2453357.1 methyltransferase domain-containing protein [Nostoc sp. FACHB-87]MBD2475481.1 methyltransferase domain-containing protein [Anabaena sp. FACHB-83]MBD2490253.1 methyltransferase domain-containing protein [Aulosira sp. FACHB-615]